MNIVIGKMLAKVWEVWVDGSCIGNPGPGGYGVYAKCGREEITKQGGEDRTTSSRMELMAAIVALEELPAGSVVKLTSDSQYAVKGITEWVPNWRRNGWKTAGRKSVKNQDLWHRLHLAAQRHNITWSWVRGHDGNPGNERSHTLAEDAARRQDRKRVV